MDDPSILVALRRLDPAARDELRRLLVRGQPDRDAIAGQLLRRRTPASDATADLLDMLTLDGDARRRVARLLGELEARQ